MIDIMDSGAKLGTVAQVVFSGGEPTLLKDDLLSAIEHASSLGMITRVVTNGWWGGTSEAQAIEYLDKLIDAGLTEINLSIDDLHQDWIPLSKVKNAFLACQKRRFPTLIAHKETIGAKITKDYLCDFFGVELISYVEGEEYTDEQNTRLISTGNVVPVGTSTGSVSGDSLYLSNSWKRGCSSILKDIIVGPNGQLQPCCGIVTKNLPELTLGDVRTESLVDLIDEANNDAMLNWIALEGPYQIMQAVMKENPDIEFEQEYTGICHACNDLLTRSDSRAAIERVLPKNLERIALHRAFFEKIRAQKDLVDYYL